MPTAVLEDGSRLEVSVQGEGASLLLPGPDSGATTALLVEGLASAARVVAFDYEAHLGRRRRAGALTVDAVTRDLLAVADAAGATTFCYLGHSWLALAGAHLASTSPRMRGLVIGTPPLLGGSSPARASPAHPADRTAVAHLNRQLDAFLEDARTRATLSRTALASLDLPRLCIAAADGASPLPPSAGGSTEVPPPWWDPADLERSGWSVVTPEHGAPYAGARTPVTEVVDWLASVDAGRRRPPGRQRTSRTTDRLCVVEDAPAATAGSTGRAAWTYADRTDAYLSTCGIPEQYFDDRRLRSRAEELLAFLEAETEHLRTTGGAARRAADQAAGRRGVRSGPGEGGAAAAPVHLGRVIAGRQREQLEVAVILRFQELRRADRDRADGGERTPRLRAVDDD